MISESYASIALSAEPPLMVISPPIIVESTTFNFALFATIASAAAFLLAKVPSSTIMEPASTVIFLSVTSALLTVIGTTASFTPSSPSAPDKVCPLPSIV